MEDHSEADIHLQSVEEPVEDWQWAMSIMNEAAAHGDPTQEQVLNRRQGLWREAQISATFPKEAVGSILEQSFPEGL